MSEIELSKQKIKQLRHFNLLNRLSDAQLVVLLSKADNCEFKKGSVIIELNSTDSNDYFLLEGEAKLIAQDGRESSMTAESDAARLPIAHLQPRHYEVRAKTPCRILVVDQPTLAQMLDEAPLSYQMDDGVEFVDSITHPEDALIASFYQELKGHRLKLPSLPNLAEDIRTASERPSCTVSDIAKIILTDPAITAKLVHAANSPLYRGFKEIETCEDAVVRLGLEASRQLIFIFTLREVFSSKHKVLQKEMTKLWRHSSEVGATAFVLARMTPGLNPGQALLAGILHDIGAVPVILFAEDHPVLRTHEGLLDKLIHKVRRELGCKLLEEWRFPATFVDVINYADEYQYDSGNEKASYAELIIVAQIHSFIGKSEHKNLPAIDQVPSFNKLASGDLTPERSMEVLQMAQEEIDSFKSLLS